MWSLHLEQGTEILYCSELRKQVNPTHQAEISLLPAGKHTRGNVWSDMNLHVLISLLFSYHHLLASKVIGHIGGTIRVEFPYSFFKLLTFSYFWRALRYKKCDHPTFEGSDTSSPDYSSELWNTIASDPTFICYRILSLNSNDIW